MVMEVRPCDNPPVRLLAKNADRLVHESLNHLAAYLSANPRAHSELGEVKDNQSRDRR
jgi:hypothetical protein